MVYPAAGFYDEGHLKVDKLHTLYYSQSGNPNGKPVIFLHGGPGGGTAASDTVYFDPQTYRIILLDQRGAGKSKPSAELKDNTTWDLVNDIELLREKLKIDKWLVFGGSWGSTLTLAYAQSHPDRCTALIMRGIFLLRKSELQFFYQEGTSHIFPEAWDDYLSVIPENERGDLIKAYHSRLTSDDDEKRLAAAKAWSKWEMTTSRLIVNPDDVAKASEDDWANAFARIEAHYFINGGFMEDGALLKKENIDKIRHLPCITVQGRYDMVCPSRSAFDLKKAWPDMDLRFIPDAGHSAREEGIKAMLVNAADEFRKL